MIKQSYLNHMCIRSIEAISAQGTLLLIHGLGESGLCFENSVESLAHDPVGSAWDILIPDLPGYGKSLPPSRPLSLTAIAAELTVWLQPLLKPPIVVLGHSMGGVITQLLCEAQNPLIHGFINVEGNLTPGDCVFSGQAARYEPDEFATTGFAHLKQSVYANGLNSPSQRGYFASMSLAWAPQFHLNSQNLVAFSSRHDAIDRFAKLDIPKLYISGYPHGICRESRTGMSHSNAPAIAINNAGHWPFIDQPQQFLSAVSFFLKSLCSV